jgi:hypothetical protein
MTSGSKSKFDPFMAAFLHGSAAFLVADDTYFPYQKRDKCSIITPKPQSDIQRGGQMAAAHM